MAAEHELIVDNASLDSDLLELLDQFRQRLSRCTPQQNWLVIYHLLHDQMGDNPRDEAAIYGDNGESYVHVVPQRLWLDRLMEAGPELELDEQPSVTLSDAIQLIGSGNNPRVVCEQIDKLWPSAR